MKKLVSLLLVVSIAVLMLSGCAPTTPPASSPPPSSSPPESQGTPPETPPAVADVIEEGTIIVSEAVSWRGEFWKEPGAGRKIAVVLTSYDSQMYADIFSAGHAYCRPGDTVVEYVTEGDATKLVSILEDCIVQKFDLVIFSSIDPEAVYAPLMAAKDAGIPMMNIDFACNYPELIETMVVADDYLLGFQTGEQLAKAVNYKGKVGAWGHPEQSVMLLVRQRLAGLRDALQQYPEIEIIFNDVPSRDPAQFLAAMEATLQANPDLVGWYSGNEAISVATSTAIRASGIDVKLVSLDLSPTILDLIKDGYMYSTQDSRSDLWGFAMMDCAYKILDGKTVADKYIIQFSPVNAENVDEYLAKLP